MGSCLKRLHNRFKSGRFHAGGQAGSNDLPHYVHLRFLSGKLPGLLIR
jgi:hypothetical protein